MNDAPNKPIDPASHATWTQPVPVDKAKLVEAERIAHDASLDADAAIRHVHHVQWAGFAASVDAEVAAAVSAAVDALPDGATQVQIARAEWKAIADAKLNLWSRHDEQFERATASAVELAELAEKRRAELLAMKPGSSLGLMGGILGLGVLAGLGKGG